MGKQLKKNTKRSDTLNTTHGQHISHTGIEREDLPVCSICPTVLTRKHILTEYTHLILERHKHFKEMNNLHTPNSHTEFTHLIHVRHKYFNENEQFENVETSKKCLISKLSTYENIYDDKSTKQDHFIEYVNEEKSSTKSINQ